MMQVAAQRRLQEAALNWVSDHGLDPPLKKKNRSWARPIPRPMTRERPWTRDFSKGKAHLNPASCVHYVGSGFE